MPDTDSTSSLASFYLAKRADLVRFFTLRTGSAAEGEDIVQEIFLKIANLDAGAIENQGAFLYKLGANILLDRLRSRKRAAARENAYFDLHAGSSRAELADDAPSPESSWTARRELERILEIVESFPPQRRRVFTLIRIDGLSYADVAENLNISKSAVEKHMTLAMRQLLIVGLKL